MSPENFQFEVAVMHALQSYTRHTVDVLGWCNAPMAICMEKYDMSLAHLIKRENFTLGINHVFTMMKQVCEALQACEELMIVHNDLKPGTIDGTD